MFYPKRTSRYKHQITVMHILSGASHSEVKYSNQYILRVVYKDLNYVLVAIHC